MDTFSVVVLVLLLLEIPTLLEVLDGLLTCLEAHETIEPRNCRLQCTGLLLILLVDEFLLPSYVLRGYPYVFLGN